MNKIFNRIAGLMLGLSLVAGAAFLSSKVSYNEVKAGETLVYTLDGTIAGSGNKYNGDNSASQGGVAWKINGNITANPWRVGGNKSNGLDVAGTVRHIQSQSAVSSEDITKVVVDTTKPSSDGITPTAVALKVGASVGGSTITSTSSSWSSSITFTRPADTSWASRYFEIDFTMPQNNTTKNKFIEINSIQFYYDAPVERGEVSVNDLSNKILFVGDSGQFTYTWDPLSSGATVKSVSWTSSNTDALTIDNSGNYSVVGVGAAKVTLHLTDSNDQAYEESSSSFYTSNDYSFELDDQVAIVDPITSMELTSFFVNGSTKYGVGSLYEDKPNGTYAFTVENGDTTCPGSLTFNKSGNYLSWSSGNTIVVSNTKNVNSSWYVVSSSVGIYLINAANESYQLWWNNTSTSLRFACYENKTPGNSYHLIDLVVVEEIPVRGTIAITSPTAKLMKQNETGDLTFDWTPAEGTSTQITSHTWTSSHNDIISINGDSYTAVAPGKAHITLNATDGIGQNYTEMTAEITVVEVVSGNYEKVTSVKDGDVVAIVHDEAEAQFSGITSNAGTYVFYDGAPGNIFDFTLVASGEYFAFLSKDNKYLSWKEEAKIEFVDPEGATDNAYWSISFDESGNANIFNKALDGEGHRYIAWNSSSPRFSAYKTGQSPVQLYAPVISYSEAVVNFAVSFLEYDCDENGQTRPDPIDWLAYKGDFEGTDLTNTDREDLRKAKAIEYENPSTDVEKVQAAMAKYDYIIVKYNKIQGLSDLFPDFINRDPSVGRVISVPTRIVDIDDSMLMMIVVIYGVVSISSISALIIIKRKKHLN